MFNGQSRRGLRLEFSDPSGDGCPYRDTPLVARRTQRADALGRECRGAGSSLLDHLLATAHSSQSLSIFVLLAPVLVPAQGIAAADHGPAEVAVHRADAPCGRTLALARSFAAAAERRPANQNVTGRSVAQWSTEQSREVIARDFRRCGGTRVAGAVGPVHFASRDAGEPYPRPLRAPDRAVAVRHLCRRASEGDAGG